MLSLYTYLYHHQLPFACFPVQLVSFKFSLNVDGNCLLKNKSSSFMIYVIQGWGRERDPTLWFHTWYVACFASRNVFKNPGYRKLNCFCLYTKGQVGISMHSPDPNTSAPSPTYFHRSPISEIFLEKQKREILPLKFQFHTIFILLFVLRSGFYYCWQGRAKIMSFIIFNWQPAMASHGWLSETSVSWCWWWS